MAHSTEYDGDVLVQRNRAILAGLAAIAMPVLAGSPLIAALPTTRTISFHNIHTKETVSVQYMVKGQHVPEALEKVNWVLRDWRKNESTRMDPALVDLLWEIHSELGSNEPIHVISGFRSRSTNEMLRKSVGGQASESRHILGKAADVHFPDVPLKRLRYSALIRERGGVGYYPTSAIPFVHVDTDRVRHWPRLPRFELALLFPGGSSKHVPADGGPITREDVRIAQSRHRDLAVQVAEFFDLRRQPRPGIAVADAGGARVQPVAERGRAPAAPTRPAEQKVAALAPVSAPAPRLVTEPKLVERPSRFTPRPSESDRAQLDQLVTLASFSPSAEAPRLVAEPRPVARKMPRFATAGSLVGSLPSVPAPVPSSRPEPPPARVAALDPAAGFVDTSRLTDASLAGWGNGWVQAPAYDEEHPEELSYRPFPLAPLLTESASADDPALAQLEHPDVARTVDLIDQPSAVLPMRFRPGERIAQLMWAQQFKGSAVNNQAFEREDEAAQMPPGLTRRGVTTR